MSDTTIINHAVTETCAACRTTWPTGAAQCPVCGCKQTAGEVAAAGEAARDAANQEADRFDQLVLTDPAAGEAIRMYAPLRALVIEVPEHGAIPDNKTGAVAHVLMERGAPTYTWCSRNHAGARLARHLHDALPVTVEHVTLTDPLDWKGATPTFAEVLGTAKPVKPPAIARRAPDHASPQRPYTEPAPFDTSPSEVARRIVRSFAEELLIVAPPEHDRNAFSTGFALDPATGIWRSGGDPWARWLRKIAEAMTFDAAMSGLTGKALTATLSGINRIKRPSMVEDVRKFLRAELDDLREHGEPCTRVTECRDEKLNQNMRYIGAMNGVVDLNDGKLLPPDQGRKALVTARTPVPFDPAAKHPGVARLFSHLGRDAERWWWEVLGSALRTVPKRLYAAVGEPNGGKTTLLNAINWTLGPYARKAARGVLSGRNRQSETQLTPGLTAWFMPVRFVLIEEEKRRQILDAGLVKDLTGGGFLSARGMRENLREGKVGATTVLFANTDSVPRLSLETEGMRDRYRELPYAKVQDVDPTMRDVLSANPEFQAALLARLVEWAARTPEPPVDIPEVTAATAERVREDQGEIGEFSKRFVADGSGTLTFSEVWSAWCLHCDEQEDAREPGGIGKRRLGNALRDYVRGLPALQVASVNGKRVRGWRGWVLADEAPEPAGQHPDDLVYDAVYELLPDHAASTGTPMTGTKLMAELHRRGAGMRLVCWTSPVLVAGRPRDVTFAESAELYRLASEYSRLKGREVDPPAPAPGAKRYAVIERGTLQNGDQKPPDTETAPLPFPDGAAGAAREHDKPEIW